MYRVLSFSALSFAIKFVVGFALTKLFAFFLGPSGLGILGNLKNFTQLLASLGSLGMQRGIIRFSSEWKNHTQKMTALVGTLHVIFGVFTLLGGGLLFLFSESLSFLIFQVSNYAYVFKIAGVVLPMHGFHLMYFSLLQGLGNYKRVVGIEIAMNLLNLSLTVYLVYRFNLTGALVAVVTIPLLYFGLSFWKLSKSIKLFRFGWSLDVAKNLGLYS
ncbi:MAG: polysaccharide biosynthesis C-terminal domain-containing protein, partial [Flavobacteriaceae bacterium]